jgi:hypothetical protein
MIGGKDEGRPKWALTDHTKTKPIKLWSKVHLMQRVVIENYFQYGRKPSLIYRCQPKGYR